MQAGDRIGRYVIESLLGQGGMGEVYRARDDVLRRRVALKLLRSEPATAGLETPGVNVKRILREARMAAALDHPNVVAVFDVGEHEGIPFIVMELASGTSLRALLLAPVPPAEKVRWLTDVARALAAAHRAGLVHRDIKPDNVMVREDGVVKVLDFGIARLDVALVGGAASESEAEGEGAPPPSRARESTQEGASVFAGTPAYMAPEQIRGEPVDGRADQFAWGVMAWEVLTGKRPWEGPPESVLGAVLHQHPARLDGSAFGVSTTVVHALARALEKSRDARFPSMDALLASLGVSAGESPLASITGVPPALDIGSQPTVAATQMSGHVSVPSGRALPTARRSKRRLVVVGVMAALFGSLLGGWRIVRARRQRVAVPAPAPSETAVAKSGYAFPIHGASRLTFDPGCEEFPSLTPDGAVVVYDGAFGSDSHLVALDIASGAKRVLTHDEGWQYAASLSPDGTRIVYIDQRGGTAAIRTILLDGSAPSTLLRPGGGVRPSWSPDGRAIWSGPYELVERVDVTSGAVTRRLAAPPSLGILQLVELPDGRVAVRFADRVTKHSSGLGVFDVHDSLRMLSDASFDETLTLAPEGASLLVALGGISARNDLWQVPLDGGEMNVLKGPVQDPTKGLAIRGDRVVWSTCRTLPSMYSIGAAPGTAKEQTLFPPRDWDDDYPTGVPGTASLVVVISDRTAHHEPWVLDTSGKTAPRMLNTGGLNPLNPVVSPDARWVAFTASGRNVYVMPFDGSAPPRRLTHGDADGSPTFGRDGKTLYFQTNGPGGRSAVASVPLDGSAEPVIVLERAKRPTASPTADTLAYSTDDGREEDEVRVLDLRSRASTPVSAHLPAGNHVFLHYSPDGKLLLVGNGFQEILEVAISGGAIVKRYEAEDQIGGAAFVGGTIVFTQYAWRGDLWMATRGAGKGLLEKEP